MVRSQLADALGQVGKRLAVTRQNDQVVGLVGGDAIERIEKAAHHAGAAQLTAPMLGEIVGNTWSPLNRCRP